ncbi:hypothetical protein G9464_19370 [Halostella sp. JP-L12]|uniref:hypothetical protein n=1 Tax=Halostella TaxID=1843185 RepID=UPI000EF7BE92|nr:MULTISPECIES: hypothetical protein [Halostella]NHN49733.1 hypothetical protein [Halostella sp. JP-L12]
MTEPALREDGGITVVKLYETSRETETVGSIPEAIEAVRAARSSDTVCEKIVTRDDTVVYSSDRNGDIDDWAAEWRTQKRRLSASSEPVHQCPYQNPGCTDEEPCVQCQMDAQAERYSEMAEDR